MTPSIGFLVILRTYNVCAFVFCFCSFLWTLHGHVFHGAGKARRGPLVIRLLGPPFIVLHALFLIRVKSGYRRAVAGMVMYTTALLLFWSCASNTKTKHLSLVFSGDVPDRLRVDGPYRYLRHPFYGSYCLAWFSGAAASGNGWLLLSALLMTAIYSMAAHMEEVGFASSPLASQYAAYRVRTGMFIPRLPGAGRRR